MSTTATTDRTTIDEWADCPDWCERHMQGVGDPHAEADLPPVHAATVTVGSVDVIVERDDAFDPNAGHPAGTPTVLVPQLEDVHGQQLHDLIAALRQARDLAEGSDGQQVAANYVQAIADRDAGRPVNLEHVEQLADALGDDPAKYVEMFTTEAARR